MFEPASALAIISTYTVLSVGGFPPDYHLYIFENMGQPVTTGRGLNDKGQIVGLWFDPTWEAHGFLWENGRIQDLDEGFADPELILAIAWDIAEDGTVAAQVWDGFCFRTQRQAVWRDGVATVLPLPDECEHAGDLNAIDPQGTMIVGECQEGAKYQFPVIWQVSDGTPTIIGWPDDIPPDAKGEIMDINRDGTALVNYVSDGEPDRAFYWRDGEFEEILNPFEEGENIHVLSINDSEAYRGAAEGKGPFYTSFFVDGEEFWITATATGTDLNNAGVGVGSVLFGDGHVHPRAWFSGTVVDLWDYFSGGYEDSWARAINNYGWITGYADVEFDVTDAWLLVPIYDKGDYDGDGDVDLQDSGHFQRCFAAEDYIDGTLHVGCSVFDFDDDVDLDLSDYAAFQSAFTGPTAPNNNPNGPG